MRTGLFIALSLCLLGAVIGQTETQQEQQTDQQPGQTQQQANSWIRFTHGYSTAGPIDVYFDNLPTPSWNWIPFRQVTAYKPILSGQHSITLVRANATRIGEAEQTEQQQQTDQQTDQQTEQQTEGQQQFGQEQLQPLSQFFSSDDILLEADFNIQDGTFYSFAWFAAQDQQMAETDQEQTDQMTETDQEQTEQMTETDQEQQTEQQSKQQTDMQEGQQEQQQQAGLIQSTNSWALYIDRLETAEGQVRLRWIHLVPEFPQASIFLQPAGNQQQQQQEQAVAQNLNFLSASEYSTVQPGTYNIIIRAAQPQQQTEQPQQQTDQQTEQETDEQQTDEQQTEQETEQQTEQPQQQQQGEELRRIERVQLLAGNVYSGWILGPLQEEQQQQEESQIAAIIKFDNFELLTNMMGQQQAQ